VISSTLNTLPPRAATGTITLEIFLKVDACYKTVFVADHIFANMEFKIKDLQRDTEQAFEVFTDSISIAGTDCGPRKFTLTSDRAEMIAKIDAPNRKVLVQTKNPAMQGLHTITVVIELERYPDLTQYIKKTKTFTINVTAVCDRT
jgi:hypothetical protein